jgi:hypothetical protein
MRLRSVCSLVFLSVVALAQTKVLQPQQTLNLGVHLSSDEGLFNDSQCDSQGNTFATIFDPAEDQPGDRPLLMFDSAGKLKARIATSRKPLQLAPNWDAFEPSFLLRGGEVARLAWSKDAIFLVKFSADGKLASRMPLAPPAFTPYYFVVFPTGEILVAGLQRGLPKIFTAIYAADGRLLKHLSFPEDQAIDEAVKLGDARYTPAAPISGNRAISAGRLRLGDDGNAYLMRSTSPAKVYVISSSGELLRNLELDPPDIGQTPMAMQLSGDRIAMEFWHCSNQCETTELDVFDANTGKKVSGLSRPGIFGSLSCFTEKPERFTFLTVNDDRKLARITAVAK